VFEKKKAFDNHYVKIDWYETIETLLGFVEDNF
jgi:hypothetical protein